MYQEIVLSSTFIEFLDNIFSYKKGYTVLDHLKTETLIRDNTGFWVNEIDSYIRKSPHPQKGFLETLMATFVQQLKFEDHNPGNTVTKNQIMNSIIREEVNLALGTEDKIILRNDLPLNGPILKKEHGVEVLNFEQYIEPPPDSRLLVEKRKVELVKGDPFDFINFVKPYIINAKKIIVQDGYLFNHHAWINFNDILSLIQENQKIIVNTLSDKARNDSRDKKRHAGDGIVAKEKLVEVFERFNLKNTTLSFGDKKKYKARKIETEQYLIHLADSLDFIGKDSRGECFVKKNSLITVLSK